MAGQGRTVCTLLIWTVVLLAGFISTIEGSRCLLNRCTCTPYRVKCNQVEDSHRMRFTGAERMDVKYVVLTWNARGLLDTMCPIFPKLVEIYIDPGVDDDQYLECASLPSICSHVEVSCR
jgi:hypothetical protein